MPAALVSKLFKVMLFTNRAAKHKSKAISRSVGGVRLKDKVSALTVKVHTPADALLLKFYIRSQNTVESDSTDECESEYILPRTKISARSCKLEGNTEAFQASEVYQDPDNHP